VDYDTEAVPRLIMLELHRSEDLSADQVARLRRVAQTCPVRRTLEAGFRFEERVITVPGPPRRSAA
jgi:uncharacterized OsmC-like protein